MPQWEIIAACSEIHTKHINTMCGQHTELFNVKLVAYKEASGISGVKNTCTSYTSSPTWWGFRILCGFSPLKWSAVQFVLFCYRVTKISVNLSIHYFGSYFHTPSKSTNHSKTHSSCKHESQKIRAII